MFNKSSVSDYVETEIKPKVMKDIEIEENINKPIFTDEERKCKEKVEKKIKKLVNKKKLDLSFEQREHKIQIPEIEQVKQ